MRLLTFQAVALLISASSLLATSVRPLNLIELVELADRVFLGRCHSVQALPDGPFGLPVVEYIFRVEQGIKGASDGQDVMIRQVQAGSLGPAGLSGIPQYQKGARMLLFLHGDSRLGLTSPVGLGQGAFWLVETSGVQGLMNSLGNANLSYQLDRQAASQRVLTSEDMEVIGERQPIPIAAFARLVKKINDQQKAGALR